MSIAFQEYHHFSKAVALGRTVKPMCVMARCITYFTMLVELLIIKNVKFVGVMLSTGYRSLIHPPFYMSSGLCLKHTSVLLIQ